MSRILIAEDEPRIAAFVARGLEARGFTTVSVSDGESALRLARDDDFDLLVLDVGLPKLDGFEVLDGIRGRGEQLPVVLLTARTEVQDTVAGFARGADDYVAKPFRFEELLARVQARLRDRAAPWASPDHVLSAGGVTLDTRTRRATVAGRTVDLSTTEFQLCELFMRHAGQVLSREQVLSQVWGYDFQPGSNVVDVYVRYLRRKLGPSCIETVRGAGYRFATTTT